MPPSVTNILLHIQRRAIDLKHDHQLRKRSSYILGMMTWARRAYFHGSQPVTRASACPDPSIQFCLQIRLEAPVSSSLGRNGISFDGTEREFNYKLP